MSKIRSGRTTSRFMLAALALLSLGGCRSPMPTVDVKAEQNVLKALAGRWEGSYESEENGREGSIQFELGVKGDTARGEILMRPAVAYEYQGSARGEQNDLPRIRTPTLLPIRFVQVDEGQVLGTLDTYIDPDCSCPVTTNFIGTVFGDEARGIYAIRSKQQWLAYGEWRAHRQPKKH